MLEFLKKRYPFNNNYTQIAKIVFFVSLALSIFLYFFQPFELNMVSSKQKFIFSSLIGLITFSVLTFNLWVIPSYFSKVFDAEKWTVWKEIIWNTWLITSVGLAYYLFLKIMKLELLTGIQFIKLILLSVIPISLFVIINQNRLLKLNLTDAHMLNKKLMQKLKKIPRQVTFSSEYNESLTVDPEKILVIRSAGNYIEIYFLHDSKLLKKMMRMTLKKAESLLSQFAFIVRTHRSFLVNIHYITHVLGNSQGLKLSIQHIDYTVPVSRNYITRLKELI